VSTIKLNTDRRNLGLDQLTEGNTPMLLRRKALILLRLPLLAQASYGTALLLHQVSALTWH